MNTGLYTIEPKGDEFVLSNQADEIIGRFSSRDGALTRAKHLMDADAGPGIFQQTKTEDGIAFPPGAYAFVPDRESPSTWKLRLWQTLALKETATQVGAAIAAIGPGGFRGRRVQIPADDRPAVLRRIRAAWTKAHPDASRDDMPAVLKRDTFASDDKDGEGDRELFELKGVEIFRTGRWKGTKYTIGDLDDIVASFGPDKAGFRPPVKLGHFNKSGDPAFGWIGGIRRVGTRLVADLIDLPKVVFDAIRDRRFDAVSAEIAFDLEVNDKTFRRVLLGIALLGSDIPAVAGLKPLRDVAADLGDLVHSEIHIYTLRDSKEDPMENKDILTKHPEAITKIEADLAQAKKDGDDDRAKTLALKLLVKRAEFAEAENEKLKADLAASEEAKKAAESKGSDDGESAVKMARMQAEIDEGKKKFADSEKRAKDAEIKGKLDKLNIPALRPTMEALYALAYTARDSGNKVFFTYSEGTGDDRKTHSGDVDPVTVIDSHMEIIQSNTAKLFAELGFAGDFGPDEAGESEDVGQKLEDRITAYMADHDKASRAEAQTAVFKADPALKAAYAAT